MSTVPVAVLAAITVGGTAWTWFNMRSVARNADRAEASANTARAIVAADAAGRATNRMGGFLAAVQAEIKPTGPVCDCGSDGDIDGPIGIHTEACQITTAYRKGPWNVVEKTVPHNTDPAVAAWEISGPSEPDPWVEPTVTYSLPGQPTTGRTVTGTEDGQVAVTRSFRRHTDGEWTLVASDDPDDVDQIGVARWSWSEVLDAHSVTLDPLTAAEKESELLYGPVGARWGDPDKQCPWMDKISGKPCNLGLRHTGAHEDGHGNILGMTEEAVGAARIHADATPGQPLCTCGHPAAHEPACYRYGRVAGLPAYEPPF